MNYIYKARLNRVVDGDTVVLDIDLGFGVTFTETVRLARIDAPERGTPGAAEATVRLARLLAGQSLELESHSFDRYKRAIGSVRIAGASLDASDELLLEGLAKPYKG